MASVFNIKETWRHTGLPSHWGKAVCSYISQPIQTWTSLIISEATSFVVAFFFFSLYNFYHVVQCNIKHERIIFLESGWLYSSIYTSVSIRYNDIIQFLLMYICFVKSQSYSCYTRCLSEPIQNLERLFQLHTKHFVGQETENSSICCLPQIQMRRFISVFSQWIQYWNWSKMHLAYLHTKTGHREKLLNCSVIFFPFLDTVLSHYPPCMLNTWVAQKV